MDNICKRIYYIDNIKFIGIFLIVLGHMPLTNTIIHNWIFSFHVPLFFFVSGFLYKEINNLQCIKKNIYSLILVILPYFIVNLLFSNIINLIFYKDEGFSLESKIYNYILCTSEMGPFWFCISLFWMKIIYNYFYNRYHNHWCLLFVSIIISLFVYYLDFRFNYYQVTTFLISFPFYCLGYSTKSLNIINRLNLSKHNNILTLLIVVILFVITFLYSGEININGLVFGNNFICFFIVGILGISFTIIISTMFKSNVFIINISNGTIIILGLHMILIMCFKFIYRTILHIKQPPPYMDTFSGIVISLLILILLYPFIKWILHNKYSCLRFLAGKK